MAAARPVGVSIVFLALAVLGLVSVRGLSVDLMPDVEAPWISITTRYEGVAPEEIETLITRPIEKYMAGVEGVQRLEGQSAEGLSRVFMQFDWQMDPDVALEEVRMALDGARSRLPVDADPPNIYKFNLAGGPVLELGLEGSGDMRELKYLAEQRLGPELERLPGVASIDPRGGRDREIRVELDLTRLSGLGISGDEVRQALFQENLSVSAGNVEDAGREVLVRAEGEFKSLADIEETVVKTVEGRPVRVKDIGKVLDSIREVKSELWIDGKPGIELRVFKQTGANTVAVAQSVRDEIERINERYRGRAKIQVLHDSSKFIRSAVTGVQHSAIIGAVLATLVLLLFLRSLRATLVVAAAIPLSVLSTFILMHQQDMTLNLISFGGLALGIGILVDGAVVILESIYRKREEGLSSNECAVEGAIEVASAVLAGTVTTVAVFVPVVFVGELAGIVFSEMALVVSFSLLCALAVALTLVPMLARQLLRRPAMKKGRFDRVVTGGLSRLEERYGRAVSAVLHAPWAVVVGALTLFGSSWVLMGAVGAELTPQADEAQIEADLELPLGTRLSETTEVVHEIERRMMEVIRPEETRHRLASAGPEAWWRMDGSNTGEVEFLLVPAGERKRSVHDLVPEIEKALKGIPGAKIRVRPRSTNPLARIIRGGDDRLAVEIRGHDLKRADRLAEEVKKIMTSVPGISTALPDRELGKLERTISVDRSRAAELGLGSADVARAVETYLNGRIATQYRDRGDEFDLRVQLDPIQSESLAQLAELPLITPTGEIVPLHAVARIVPRIGPSSISRINQERVLRVSAWPSGRPLGEIAADLERKLAKLPIPDGFAVSVEGETAEQEATFHNLLMGIVLSLFLVFSVMAIQFESLKQPLIIMVSVPFALTGVATALLLTDTTLNMYSLLGAIVLIGIVVNNAIVLIDYTNTLRKRDGMSVRDALVAACRRRLRPILMTTLTTLLGLVPLAIGLGEGSEMQSPMARAIVGGLLTSTIVTLFLVPAVYFLVEGRGEPLLRVVPRDLDESGPPQHGRTGGASSATS